MKLISLEIKNFRSIESLTLDFPRFYAALCGKNDAGKTNVMRALRTFFREEETFRFYGREEILPKEDFPKWLEKDARDKTITVSVTLEVFNDSDEGLYLFLADYLALEERPSLFTVRLTTKIASPSGARDLIVHVENKEIESLKGQEVLKKLQSSPSVIFHDSTDHGFPYEYRHVAGFLKDLSTDDDEQLRAATARVDRTLDKIAKRSQKDLTDLLGRLHEKYRIGLSAPEFDVTEYPFGITLGTEKIAVPLEKWGSGTQNRTRILMALFKAKRVAQSATSASKVTPIIVIEEPESFLHPSAQAEFGSILRDMAEEFKVQVIVATHSTF